MFKQHGLFMGQIPHNLLEIRGSHEGVVWGFPTNAMIIPFGDCCPGCGVDPRYRYIYIYNIYIIHYYTVYDLGPA